MPRTVVFVVFEEGKALDLVGPLDVFAGANAALAEERPRAKSYELVVAGPSRGPVRQDCGLAVVAEYDLESLPEAIDTLVVAGGAGARAASADDAIVARVAEVASRAKRVASVCTGAFVLAAAGLLDGRRATTHWTFCDALAARFPRVQVDPDPIFVRDGSRYTSAGVTAGIDLALALVEADHGRDIASFVARRLVVFVRRAGGQSQFSAPLRAQATERSRIRSLQDFVVEHPHVLHDVPSLAKRAGMSARHFSRLFHAETGVSPAAYVDSIRCDAARRLLETTELSIEQVAAHAGFGTPKSMHRSFARSIGVSPREYRARFGA